MEGGNILWVSCCILLRSPAASESIFGVGGIGFEIEVHAVAKLKSIRLERKKNSEIFIHSLK